MNSPLILLAVLGLALVGCSSDSEESGGDDKLCVKVTYHKTGGTTDGFADEPCAEYPAECTNPEDPCGNSDACSQALDALCKEGSERNVCVSTSLNDKVTGIDLGCQIP